MAKAQSIPESLWMATAESAPQADPLKANCETEVAVIGAGYAGLSTALHLAEAGINTTLLEANEIGWGASGRSGGQVIPGIKYDPDEMCGLLGSEAGKQAAIAFGSTASKVFDLIDRHDIKCEAVRAGWLQPAHTHAAEVKALDRCRQWQDMGADVEPLSAEATADLLGTDVYHKGWIDRRGGSVQPLSYTRGLARACLSAGVRVAPHTRVNKLSSVNGHWELDVESGFRVRADQVVICTNAYTDDLWPGLRKSVIAVNSFQIATPSLPPDLDGRILKGGIVASDTRNLLSYWRRDAAGRLILGGRGSFDDPTSPRNFVHLERALHRLYPETRQLPIKYRWGGRVAVTRDHLPHIHQPEEGVSIIIGCQGRGIGLQTSMGQWLADYLTTGKREYLPLPVTRIRQIPAHALRRLYVSAVIAYYKARDMF